MKQRILSLAVLCLAAFAASCSDDDKNNDGGTTPPGGKTYKIGDLYDVGGVKGIVIRLDDASGKHGLIVSLDETRAQWAVEAVAAVRTGAGDTDDGVKNQAAIEAIADWQTKFPAFAWCGAKNTGGITGWYLPAYFELGKLFEAYTADPESFNLALTGNGGEAVTPTQEAGDYWSSSENLVPGKEGEAAALNFFIDSRYFKIKTKVARVRAVHAF